jgi:hypothetical protein
MRDSLPPLFENRNCAELVDMKADDFLKKSENSRLVGFAPSPMRAAPLVTAIRYPVTATRQGAEQRAARPGPSNGNRAIGSPGESAAD